MNDARSATPAVDGAWARRPSHSETISDRRITPTRQKPLEVLRYEDATSFDRLLATRLISSRQHDAARIAHMMMLAAGLIPRMIGRLDTLDDMVADSFEAEPEREARDPDAPTPRDRYRALMRRLGNANACVIEAMLLGEMPTRTTLPNLVTALDKLADILGVR